MADALRVREKERVQLDHLFTEALPVDEAAFTLTLPSGVGHQFGLMSLSLDMNDVASSKQPPASSRKNVSFLTFSRHSLSFSCVRNEA